MCGLLYIDRPWQPIAFSCALASMRFRGPDAESTEHSSVYSIGHVRLSIQGLTDYYTQPFYSKSGRHVIIFNGEIYNYKELAKKYFPELSCHCDTELLVELFEKIGTKMLTDLNGMFALIIINVETGARFVARDRLGIKPLFVSEVDGAKIYCSEIAPISKLRGGNLSISELAERQYRVMRGFFKNRTIYQEVSSFPPGHFELDGRIVRYWSLPEGEQSPPGDDELFELLQSAVNMRMLADVDVGTYLSGGLDSSFITALAGDVKTWSAGSRENNEFYWSGLMSQHLGLDNVSISVEPEEYQNAFKSMVLARQEPLSVPNEVLLYRLTQEVSTQNKVVLSGEGADELFFGYDRIFRWANETPWSLLQFSEKYCYGDKRDLEVVEEAMEPYQSYAGIDKVARFFQLDHLHGLLRRLDFSTMFCGVEARVPFVDHRLVERMAGVSFDYRVLEGEAKAPLKRLACAYLPKDVVYRKKIGFPVDLAAMLGDAAGYDSFFDLNMQYLRGEK